MAVASAAHLTGTRGVVMLRDSGLGNAVTPLTSLNAVFRIPVLVIATWRGEADEPQHELMGKLTPALFDQMRIRWQLFPDSDEQAGPALRRAGEHMSETRLPYAFLVKKGMVADHPLRLETPTAARRPSARRRTWRPWPGPAATRGSSVLARRTTWPPP